MYFEWWIKYRAQGGRGVGATAPAGSRRYSLVSYHSHDGSSGTRYFKLIVILGLQCQSICNKPLYKCLFIVIYMYLIYICCNVDTVISLRGYYKFSSSICMKNASSVAKYKMFSDVFKVTKYISIDMRSKKNFHSTRMLEKKPKKSLYNHHFHHALRPICKA